MMTRDCPECPHFPDKEQDYREHEQRTRELPEHPLTVLAVRTRQLVLLPVPAPEGSVSSIKRMFR